MNQARLKVRKSGRWCPVRYLSDRQPSFHAQGRSEQGQTTHHITVYWPADHRHVPMQVRRWHTTMCPGDWSDLQSRPVLCYCCSVCQLSSHMHRQPHITDAGRPDVPALGCELWHICGHLYQSAFHSRQQCEHHWAALKQRHCYWLQPRARDDEKFSVTQCICCVPNICRTMPSTTWETNVASSRMWEPVWSTKCSAQRA